MKAALWLLGMSAVLIVVTWVADKVTLWRAQQEYLRLWKRKHGLEERKP